ncbi:MAG TPA: hypothetical protein VNZ53_39360 [Steroidobacteraceae bacterium]|nr:hypothetical protein [Steroidobacteraceae bacterium]
MRSKPEGKNILIEFRWAQRVDQLRTRVRASRRPARDVSDLSDEEVRKIDLASAMF